MCHIDAKFGTKKFGVLVYLFLYLLTSFINRDWGTTWVESCILADGLTMHNWMT